MFENINATFSRCLSDFAHSEENFGIESTKRNQDEDFICFLNVTHVEFSLRICEPIFLEDL